MSEAKRGLIIWGGWDGHTPEKLAEHLKENLVKSGYLIDSTSHFGSILDQDLSMYDVIVPIWSCGITSKPYLNALLNGVKQGTGLATFHGGINWFEDDEYYKMIGGFYIEDRKIEGFSINITDQNNLITKDIDSFTLADELYFIQIDPSCRILCSTVFEGTEMPIAWIKNYGKGKVFYTTLAHEYENVTATDAINLIVNGIKWATRS